MIALIKRRPAVSDSFGFANFGQMINGKLDPQISSLVPNQELLVSTAQERAVIRKIFKIDDVRELYDRCNEAVPRKSIRWSTVEDRLIWLQKIGIFGAANAINSVAHCHIHFASEDRMMKLQQIPTGPGINAEFVSEVRALIAIRLLHSIDENHVIAVAGVEYRVVLDGNAEQLDRVVSMSGMNPQIIRNSSNSRNDLHPDKITTTVQSDNDVVHHFSVEAAGAAIDGCVGAPGDNYSVATLLGNNDIVVLLVTTDGQISIRQLRLHIACCLHRAGLVYSDGANENAEQPGRKLAL
jgi:hypothetical protein